MKSKSIKLHIFATLLITFLGVGCFVASTYMVKFMTDAVISKKINVFVIYFVVAIGLILIAGIAYGLQTQLINITSRQLANRIKEAKIKSINDANHNPAILKNDLLIKSESIVTNYYQNVFSTFDYFLRLVFSIAFAFAMNWMIGIAVVASSVVLIVFAQVKNKKAIKLQANINASNELLSKTITNNIDGYLYFRFANRETYLSNAFEEANKRSHNSMTKFNLFSITKSSTFNFILGLISFSINLSAGIAILYFNADYGTFAAAIALSFHTLGSANVLGQAIANKNSMSQVLKAFKENFHSSIYISNVNGNIELNSVSKSFNKKQIIRDFSLLVDEGEKILIVGKSGKGKSTLLKMMYGELQPDAGKMYYGGNLIEEKIVSNDIKIMTNDFSFDNNDINTVISSFDLKPQNETINYLVKKMNIDGINPANASRGELQKIKIANMIYSSCKYQFYDEPFSNIDKNDIKTVAELVTKQKKCTVIVVAHNLEKNIFDFFDRVIKL